MSFSLRKLFGASVPTHVDIKVAALVAATAVRVAADDRAAANLATEVSAGAAAKVAVNAVLRQSLIARIRSGKK